jgi:hypothetical protein
MNQISNLGQPQNPPPNFKSTPFYIPFRDLKRNAGSAADDLLLVIRNFADPIDFEHSYPSQSLCGDNPFHLRLIRKAMV